ncbi:jmjC domain-containing protein 8 isoform X3 [Pristis pectinata]|uniref:jmjC domain-containing protein 8 isoform X3 n=1 Tax=Pristis pectinata TaxID=685728 RepID=UPI00223E7759|nr:jmjC domain-containing protein 8 isoform X3 [Pristis pectinata]
MESCALRLLLASALLGAASLGDGQTDGGWHTDHSMQMVGNGSCNVEVRDSLTYSEFVHRYAYSKPVIFRGLTQNEQFRALCSKQRLLQEFGNRLVRLSTANTYSYQKVDVPFKEYVEHIMKPQSLDSLGSDTLYFFGDNNFTEWDSLFRTYIQPPYQLPGTKGAYSFGIAGAGTGVPFHWHGAGYSEVIYGQKTKHQSFIQTGPHYHGCLTYIHI